MLKAIKHNNWFLGTLLTVLMTVTSADDNSNNIIVDIINAPVVSNGLVADAATEFNVILDAKGADDPAFALDPLRFGHQIPAGDRMEIQLTGAFIIAPELVTNPLAFLTNGHVILTTGPQNPIHGNSGDSVQLGNWTATLTPNVSSGGHLITITPDGGHGKNGLENERAKKIGVKVIHVRPRAGIAPFTNGPAGSIGSIAVRLYDARGTLREAGVADVMFRSKSDVGAQVSVTNSGVRTGGAGVPQPTMEVNENTNFQRVTANTIMQNTARLPGTSTFSESLPYAPRFMLLQAAAADEPNNVGIIAHYMVHPMHPYLADLFDASNQLIGTITINGPSESSRGTLLADPGTSTNILSVPVQVGAEKGIYRVSISLLGGNQSVHTIIVADKDDEDDD